MRFVYPYETTREGDSLIVSFPDVPGAVTQVDPGEDFDELVKDCLLAALGGHVVLHRAPPRTSAARGRQVVALDVLSSAKLALATAMAEANVPNVVLAQQMGVNEKVVRRLLDLDHVSRIEKLEYALAFLDKQLEISIHTIPGSAKPSSRSASESVHL